MSGTTFFKIVESAREEVDYWKRKDSLKTLKKRIKTLSPTYKLSEALITKGFGLVAEVKFKSPSMGKMTLLQKKIEEAYKQYNNHSIVRAISVITNKTYFGSCPNFLREVRRKTQKPILRKDFIFCEYQIYQSRAIGADTILLMTDVVKDRSKMSDFYDLAYELGLEVICEIHNKKDLDLLPPNAKIVGVNSRNFNGDKNFAVSKFTRHFNWDTSTNLNRFELFHDLPNNVLKIAESGISHKDICNVLKKWPFDAALVGSSILKSNDGVRPELNRFTNEIERSNQKNAIFDNVLVNV